MLVYHDLSGLKLNNTCVTIGKFDGLHAGHQALLTRLSEYKQKGLMTVVLTFETDEDGILGNAVKLLKDTEKERLLRLAGPDVLILCPFTRQISKMSAQTFLKDVLIDRLGMKVIVAGSDFCFGAGRRGDVNFLKEKEAEYDFFSDIIPKVRINDEVVSSTAIRNHICEGQLQLVDQMLNREFFEE